MIDYNAIAKTGGIPRVSSRGGVDMSCLPFGKVNRRQRENKRARKEARQTRCEIPGCGRRAQAGPHHVIKRSQILIDHKFNFINLCGVHHPAADKYEIAQVDLFELIAAREGTTLEQLLKDLGEYAGVSLYIDGDRVKIAAVAQPAEPPTCNRQVGSSSLPGGPTKIKRSAV